MKKIAVIYWSGTGNTETMAFSVADGAKQVGAHVDIFMPSNFSVDKISEYDGIAFGCPSMGAEQLEEIEFEPMFSSVESELGGKKIVLFGSYGWGDGEWMRNWEEQCNDDGAILVSDSVVCNEAPDDDGKNACIALGIALGK